MKANRFVLLLPLVSVLMAPNCVTLSRESALQIPVTSSPAGATVIVDGKVASQAPVLLTLRKNRSHTIRIEKNGFNPAELRVTRKLTAWPVIETLAVPIIALGTGYAVFLGRIVLTEAEKSWAEYKNTFKTVVWVTGGLAAAAVIADTATGTNLTLSPRELNVTLTKADGKPRVDTTFVDAEDFRNVRWIRIHRN